MFITNLLFNGRRFAEDDDAGVGSTAVVDPPEDKGGKGGLMNDLLKERAKRKEIEKELTAARKEADEAKRAELSEIDKLKAQLAEEQAKTAAADVERAKQTRADVLRRAAAKADFADVEDVIALARGFDQLDDIETESDAERYVKALAKDKPHLLRKPESPIDLSQTSGIEKVLKDGLVEGASGAEKDKLTGLATVPVATLVAMSREEQLALKAANPDLYYRSLNALNDGPETTHTINH